MKQKTNVRNMTQGSPFPILVQFMLPLLLGNLVQQTYNMVDAIIVGRLLGADALAAVGTSSSVQFLVLGLCTGSCAGFGIPISQSFGANDLKRMRLYVWNSALCGGAVAAVITTAASLLCRPILHWIRTPEGIFSDAWLYLLILFLGIPFTIMYNLLSSILRAVGNSKMPFLFLTLSSVLNIFLDLLCVAVLGWGCAGAAAATIASQAVSGILCLIYVLKKVTILHPGQEERQFNSQAASRLMQMGLPMGLQFSITAIGSMMMQSANNSLGTVYVSAFAAGMRIKQFAMCPYDALAVAAATFVGQNCGAGKIDRVRLGIRQALALGVTYGIGAGLVLGLFGRQLCALFIGYGSPEILDAGAFYLFCLSFLFFTLACINVPRSALQSLGYSGRAMISGVLEMIARSACSILLVPAIGFTGVCVTDQTAWLSATIYLNITLHFMLKKLDRAS
ncbi:MAG: MATE family efflux transporter [Lachnospiraceae bacterium]|nr:MATE family efflux transporter [Lachnospiraceae bacterium]